MSNRRAGALYFKVDGVQYDAKGEFSYRINPYKNDAITGPDGTHGYKSMPQVQYIEGAITDASNLDLVTMQSLTQSTVTLNLANGKTLVLRDAWYAAEGIVNSEEGEVEVKFEGMSGEEISP